MSKIKVNVDDLEAEGVGVVQYPAGVTVEQAEAEAAKADAARSKENES